MADTIQAIGQGLRTIAQHRRRASLRRLRVSNAQDDLWKFITRSRVCCLYRGDVSLPSDVQGLLYKKFADSVEELGYTLIKELKKAGYRIG